MNASDFMKKIQSDIKENGWHVLTVLNEGAPNFSYSIGFTETFRHPEIIMSGLDTDLMQTLINDIGKLVENGKCFTKEQLCNEVIKDYPVKFVKVSDFNKGEYFRAAVNIYGIEKFDALQCIWPDKDGKFQETSNSSQEIFS